MSLIVTPIPAFDDNYIWLIQSASSTCVAVVDPGDSAPVLAYLEDHQLSLNAILITHHHPDHIGGVEALAERYPDAKIFAPHSAKIPLAKTRVSEGDYFTLCEHTFNVIEVPGHTLDHIAYFATSQAEGEYGSLFCGDTLFASGCGRMFEGTPPMMSASLDKLRTLPSNTLVYCAHEYTLANIAFARAVEPHNEDLAKRQEQAEQSREIGQPTLPSTIDLELRTNPFIRCHIESVKEMAQNHADKSLETQAEVFGALRAWKDNF
ncbi:MAG: hydroxyacylglutathione hydrolase [Pseudohongiellaceae bacterium]|nr:hydroxyacylglutathione hydrolase [Pseudohongiellaceae bacterium]